MILNDCYKFFVHVASANVALIYNIAHIKPSPRSYIKY